MTDFILRITGIHTFNSCINYPKIAVIFTSIKKISLAKISRSFSLWNRDGTTSNSNVMETDNIEQRFFSFFFFFCHVSKLSLPKNPSIRSHKFREQKKRNDTDD